MVFHFVNVHILHRHCYPNQLIHTGLSKRVILTGPSSPTLSQLLKEAKNTPTLSTEGGGEDEGEAPLTYSRLFDEYHGVVYLEALELLSKECSAKVHLGTVSSAKLQV